jgi:hypothetical protein
MVSAPSHAMPPLPIARFSVEQYHRMIESGAFTEDETYLPLDRGREAARCEQPGREVRSERDARRR